MPSRSAGAGLRNTLTAFEISFGSGRAAVAEPPRQVIQQLAMFSAARHRLIGVYNQLAGPLAEQQNFVDPTRQKQLLKSC